ncbi:TrlF family AAA-like ATPase [Pseudomonas sp. NUPR-001]|uniref:TrlF family AAA-like ATPase n=1 Tax=Pseudomonas sp. NUPR-001 TaxID=3416058 RepID=UPI003F98955E
MYQGFRWFKADFQVQTPEDGRHWKDHDLRLGNPRRPKIGGEASADDIRSKARVFLRRCHELDLQIIGITDHNFSGVEEPEDWFLTHLVTLNRPVAKELGRDPIWIFPGFELDLGYHVLCLFEPARKTADVQRVNKVLIELGMFERDRFENGKPALLPRDRVNLRKLLDIVQGKHGGVVIAAHSDRERGLFEDSANRQDYRQKDLLAVEVTQYPLSTKMASILKGQSNDWRRLDKPPAYVQSSDAKSLKTDSEGRPLPNSLGYRYTWVKSSVPSITALKQAFGDPQSRLSLDECRPSDTQIHPRIVSIEWKGLRNLEDESIWFSENLNTLIGGTGTGKSTILELLRIGLGRDEGDALSSRIQDKIDRARNVLDDHSELQITWEGMPGQRDVIAYTKQSGRTLVEGDAHDVAAYLRHFPVQFYSQRQLSELTMPDGALQLLQMIDEGCAADLDSLRNEEFSVKAEIARLYAAQNQLLALDVEINNIIQELTEIDREWQARKDVQGEASSYLRSHFSKRYQKQLQEVMRKDVAELQQVVEAAAPNWNPAEVAATWPHAEWLTQKTIEVNQARDGFKLRLIELLADMEASSDQLFDDTTKWPAIKRELDTTYTTFVAACEERGLKPEDASRFQELDRLRQAKLSDLDGKRKTREPLLDTPTSLNRAHARLHEIWAQEFALRSAVCEQLTERTSGTSRVTIKYMGAQVSFDTLWQRLIPTDSRMAPAWKSIGDAFRQHFLSQDQISAPSPWALIGSMLHNGEPLPGVLEQFREELLAHIRSSSEAWLKMNLERIPDLVDIELYRTDRTLIGSLSSHRLSEGQRNTAVLCMLLVMEGGPLILDQPEDDVDVSFVYHELVPLLRRVKLKRQLIVATHNVNIPVNGDAEFVLALESVAGKGRPLAQGGMDRIETARAVMNIMEGAQEAFIQRREKYHLD